MSAAGPSQGANSSPSGGSERSERGGPMSAAGPSQGRPCERGEAQARSVRPRVRMAADRGWSRSSRERKEAARYRSPTGGSAAASVVLAASVGDL